MHCDKINRHPIKGDIINFGDESIAQLASTFIQKKSQIFNVCQGLYFTIFQVKLEEEFYSFFFVKEKLLSPHYVSIFWDFIIIS